MNLIIRSRTRRLLLLAIVLAGLPASAAESVSYRTRIIGGKPTSISEHPWQVAMRIHRDGQDYLCSGSIISQHWILTAAHCVVGTTARDVQVKSNVTNFVDEGSWITVDEIRVHEKYDPGTYVNDIALLRLARKPDGQLVPLGDEARLDGKLLTVSGWGTTDSGEVSKELRQVAVPYVDNETCKASYGKDNITPGMLCAGRKEGGVDSCQGDSGGPLELRDSGSATLVGVVSHGRGCALKLFYGVYTRVSAYRTWIDGIVKPRP